MRKFSSLQDKLDRFEELEKELQDPSVYDNNARMVALQREHGGLSKIANSMREYLSIGADIEAAEMMVAEETDPDSKAYAEDELNGLREKLSAMEVELEDYATSGDSLTRGSLIMEIRAGTGGDEAALFARNLYDMYLRLVERRGWSTEVMDFNTTELGGLKEVVFTITGDGAYHELQFESGGHRVQRVPETETQGRIHTSAATVAVMAEATEVEVDIKSEDLRIDTMRAQGPGGQKVNKTESAVRITHLPTGCVVKCQDEKSQHKNRATAMRIIRSRVLELMQQRAHDERAETRRTLVGSGDRSQRIRTYNYPQNRVTDHRCGISIHKLDRIVTGEMDELIGKLLEFDRNERPQRTTWCPRRGMIHEPVRTLGAHDEE